MRGAPTRPGVVGANRSAPDARPGSLLWVMQRANQRALKSNRHRDACLAAMVSHREHLERIDASDGLRSFIETCDQPWPALWHHVETHTKRTA